MPSPRHCFKKKSQFNFYQWWALGRVTQVDFVLLNRASLEKGGSSRRYKNPGNKGGRGLTYAKIITNKRSCGAPAIIGSLFVARFLKNIVDRRIKIKPCMYVSL